MPTVRYTSVNGEVLAEKRDGVRKWYVPDPLGSTVALLDSSQTKTDMFTYWPYGEVKTRTGTTATPLQFVGTQGYYRDKVSRLFHVVPSHHRQSRGGNANLPHFGVGQGDGGPAVQAADDPPRPRERMRADLGALLHAENRRLQAGNLADALLAAAAL